MVTNFGGSSSSRGSSVSSSLDSGMASRDSGVVCLLDFLLRASVGSSSAEV